LHPCGSQLCGISKSDWRLRDTHVIVRDLYWVGESSMGQGQAAADSVAVIGAGIVGLSTAVFLQRLGCNVTVYDAQPPGGGASYGNGGLLSPDSCIPTALPGMLRQLPKWLLNPTGPLAVDPRRFFPALPWLFRRIRAGNRAQVFASAQALHELHSPALDAYRELLGPEHFSDVIRETGQLHIWEHEHETAGDVITREIHQRYGIRAKELSSAEIHDLVPDLSSRIRQGIFFPRHGHTVSPLRLVQTIGRLFLEGGGAFRQERVMKIVPREGFTFRLITNLSDSLSEKVLVAAGMWSKQLLAPLGIFLPLEAERGYHVELRGASINLSLPILHKDRAIGAIPMETGLRIAGMVEIAGLEAPLNERHGDALLTNALDLFPTLEFEQRSLWMGFRPSTPDSVPILSDVRRNPGLFIATGHGQTGITAGAVSGRLVANMMTQRPVTLGLEPYSLARF
jgi:glycine/D-amino acid oxidase-like deaminating enzyme